MDGVQDTSARINMNKLRKDSSERCKTLKIDGLEGFLTEK